MLLMLRDVIYVTLPRRHADAAAAAPMPLRYADAMPPCAICLRIDALLCRCFAAADDAGATLRHTLMFQMPLSLYAFDFRRCCRATAYVAAAATALLICLYCRYALFMLLYAPCRCLPVIRSSRHRHARRLCRQHAQLRYATMLTLNKMPPLRRFVARERRVTRVERADMPALRRRDVDVVAARYAIDALRYIDARRRDGTRRHHIRAMSLLHTPRWHAGYMMPALMRALRAIC